MDIKSEQDLVVSFSDKLSSLEHTKGNVVFDFKCFEIAFTSAKYRKSVFVSNKQQLNSFSIHLLFTIWKCTVKAMIKEGLAVHNLTLESVVRWLPTVSTFAGSPRVLRLPVMPIIPHLF